MFDSIRNRLGCGEGGTHGCIIEEEYAGREVAEVGDGVGRILGMDRKEESGEKDSE